MQNALGKLGRGVWRRKRIFRRVHPPPPPPSPTPSRTHTNPNSDTGYRSIPANIPPSADDYAPTYAALPVCPAFAQIGTHRGPFDLGLIPIGAYEPRWMFSNVHASPKDAVNIFVDTKCRRALGMHWGTWVLTEEEVMAPPRELEEACAWKGVEGFGVCEIGESTEWESGGE